MTKDKMESLKKMLTSKNTWLAIVIELGIIFFITIVISLFGTEAILIAALLALFFMFAAVIKEVLDDTIGRK